MLSCSHIHTHTYSKCIVQYTLYAGVNSSLPNSSHSSIPVMKDCICNIRTAWKHLLQPQVQQVLRDKKPHFHHCLLSVVLVGCQSSQCLARQARDSHISFCLLLFTQHSVRWLPYSLLGEFLSLCWDDSALLKPYAHEVYFILPVFSFDYNTYYYKRQVEDKKVI